MRKCVKNCEKCPFFEWFLDEYEPCMGKKVSKGICHKYHENEVWGTRASCDFVRKTSIEELEKMAFN